MIKNFHINRLMWCIAAFCALTLSLISLININVYGNVVTQEVLPGIVSQDIITAITSAFILICMVRIKQSNYKLQMLVLGYMLYLFYAYGIYVIERFYNILYLPYMFIFSFSFFTITYSMISLNMDIVRNAKIPNTFRKVSAAVLLIIPVMFYFLWISRLIPLISSGTKVEFFYSVFILDLCFIMPSFIVIGIMNFRNKGIGILLTPCALLFGSVLLLSVGIGELLKPYFNAAVDLGGVLFYLGLAAVFGAFALVNFVKLKLE